MMAIALRRIWIGFLLIDALLLLGARSAVAAPVAAPAGLLHLHLPTVLLGGLGLLVTSLTGQRIRW